MRRPFGAIDPDRDDHEVAMVGKRPNAFVLQTLMGEHRHDLAGGLADDDAPVEFGTSAIVLPGDEATDDLDDLIHSR